MPSLPITVLGCTNRPGATSFSVADYYTKGLRKEGVTVRYLDLKGLPTDFITSALYAQRGLNNGFNAIGDVVMNAKKMVWVVPEYNGSFPGVLKAFIDGLEVKRLQGHKIALVGLSAGRQGGLLALSHLSDILHHIGVIVYPLKVTMPIPITHAYSHVNGKGSCTFNAKKN